MVVLMATLAFVASYINLSTFGKLFVKFSRAKSLKTLKEKTMTIQSLSNQTELSTPYANEPAQPSSSGLQLALLLFMLTLLIVVGTAWWRAQPPLTSSVEAGFARDMATHHAQAVDLATLVRDRSENAEIRQLALDIMLTQQAQIGQMQGWLAVWGLPIASVVPAMTWMDMPSPERMPGMATPQEINQLRTLHGVEADTLFLQLMIPHHQAGVAMAEGILARTQQSEVRALAQSIVYSQQSEIAYMQALLTRIGAPTAPDEPLTDHENMQH